MVKIKDGCVICDYCGKTLFVVEDKDKGKNGVIAFKATQKGVYRQTSIILRYCGV